MSGSVPCKCEGTREEKMKNWVVHMRHCNFSAFSGYHKTHSDYSAVYCTKCPSYWRTKASYVYTLPDAPDRRGYNP